MSRIVIYLIAIPIALVIVAALLIPMLFSEEKLVSMAAETLKKQTGAVLTVDGEVSLSLFPNLSIDLNDTGITMPGAQEVSVQARSLGIGVALWPLFSGVVEVGDIVVDGVAMTVHSAPEQPALDTGSLSDRELDDFYAQRRRELESAGQTDGQEAVIAVPLALNVRRLLVTDSVLETVSAETGERLRVEIIKLEATGVNLEDVAIPLELRLRLEASVDAAPIDVAVVGKIRINTSSQQVTLEPTTVDVRGVLAQPIALQAQGVIDLVKQAADLQLELALGATQGEGKLRYASFETPQIDADLHLNLFDPALLALAGPDAGAAQAAAADAGAADAGAAQAAAAQAGNVEASESPSAIAEGDQPLPLDAIRAIDARAKLLIDRAVFSGHTVEKMQVQLRAVDGVVDINTLTGTVHGGELDMTATFNGQHNAAQLATKGGLKGLQIERALEAMESDPIATGEANLQWQLNGSGKTSNALIEAMNGPIDMVTTAVTLESLGVEKMLCEAVALTNGEKLAKKLPDNTRFDTLSVNLKMNQGKLQMAPLRAELPNIKLSGKGAMDLLKQNFSATFTARLSPGLKELDPACRVNKRLTGIGWPVDCEGSIVGDPAGWCSVDSGKILKDMATQEVHRKVEKEAGRFLDKLLKK